MFEVGEKLVCILGGPPHNGNTSESPLIEGVIYIATEWDQPRWPGDSLGVRILGCKTFDPLGTEVFWNADKRFRKLTDLQAEARARHSKPENITKS